MLNRWASMIDNSSALVINHTSNYYWKILDPKQQANILTEFTSKKMYIKYIKKGKEEKEEIDQDSLKHFAKIYEISCRELQEYVETDNLKLPKIK